MLTIPVVIFLALTAVAEVMPVKTVRLDTTYAKPSMLQVQQAVEFARINMNHIGYGDSIFNLRDCDNYNLTAFVLMQEWWAQNANNQLYAAMDCSVIIYNITPKKFFSPRGYVNRHAVVEINTLEGTVYVDLSPYRKGLNPIFELTRKQRKSISARIR